MRKRQKLDQRLRAVWDHGHRVDEPFTPTAWRYVPSAYSGDGPGWGVFDRQDSRFVEVPELLTIPVETLATATVKALTN